MILNTTNIRFTQFSTMQRLATNGEYVEDAHIKDMFEFEAIYEKLKDVSKVIVDVNDFVLVNDILNYVDCPVVTLYVETFVDTDETNFIEYYEYCEENN